MNLRHLMPRVTRRRILVAALVLVLLAVLVPPWDVLEFGPRVWMRSLTRHEPDPPVTFRGCSIKYRLVFMPPGDATVSVGLLLAEIAGVAALAGIACLVLAPERGRGNGLPPAP